MFTQSNIHIGTTAPEGITAFLNINHKSRTVDALLTDDLGKWKKHFPTLEECGYWVRSFAGPVTTGKTYKWW